MLGFIKRMFGSAESGAKLIDGAIDGIDKLYYSPEEKAEDAREAKKEVMGIYMEWMKTTTGSRLARRFIAQVVTVPWAIAHLLSTLFDAISPLITGVTTIKVVVEGKVVEQVVMNADKYQQAADSLSDNASENNALVGVVLLFYFGGPAAVEGVQGMVTKWADRKK